MTERFIIKGGKPLQGEVEIEGYKNSAGAVLAASLLTNKEVIIGNLPLVEDVFSMLDVLKEMGAEIEWIGKRKVKIRARNINLDKLTPDKVSKTRVAVLLLGSLTARFNNFKFYRPGGDRIGLRPITTHLKALEKLGAEIREEGNSYKFKTDKLRPQEIILKEFSVTATENAMMAASLLNGKTIIKGAACEPQVQDLGGMLQKMGVEISGLGTHTVSLKGRKKLNSISYKIIPDPIVTATFIVAGCLTPGELTIKNIRLDHLDLFLDKLEEIGVKFKKQKNAITVFHSPNLKASRVQTFFYPGFPTDFLPFTAVLLTQAQGKSLIHDPLYESRFSYLQELKKMGADIEIVDPHRAIILGKTHLYGLSIESWDIRGGASLILAGLIAKGKTTLNNIYQIDRGYEKIEERLQKLGADIKRVKI